jgi:glycosyltransferase involved in cell wall biosynthesis
MKLTIAHITNNYTPFKGGVVQAINATVAQQKNDGHNACIVTLDFIKGLYDDPDHVYRLPTFFKCTYSQNTIAIPWRLNTHMQAILKPLECSIFHIHHPFLLGPAALKIAKKYGIPTLFTFHTLYEEYVHYIKLNPAITKPLTRLIVRSFCNQIDSIVVPNKTIKEYVQNLGVERPILILPSPIGNDIVPTTVPAIVQQVHTPVRLLVVSRLVPEKNIESIIECMAMLPVAATLIIAGYGYWQENLKQYITKLYGANKAPITFCLNPSRTQLAQLYAWADLFLFSSKTDTQGLVLAEAMAHATPVIALYGPGQQDFVMNGQNGFLVDSSKSMAITIGTISAQPKLFRTLQHGALVTSNQYRTDTIVSKLTQHYYETIAHYKPRNWYKTFLKRVI